MLPNQTTRYIHKRYTKHELITEGHFLRDCYSSTPVYFLSNVWRLWGEIPSADIPVNDVERFAEEIRYDQILDIEGYTWDDLQENLSITDYIEFCKDNGLGGKV